MINAKPVPKRGIYLLPNAITTANLFAGFFAVMQAMNHRFEWAALAIFAAMVMDGMDGRIARLTKTQSSFGEQYDSMADMVSFGMAPALVMYTYILNDLGRWGWLAAFVYVAGAALRLARFNSNINIVDSRYFQGLPSPAAAALTAGFVWLSVDNRLPISDPHAWVAFVITVYAGLTMISNAPFFSGKSGLFMEKKSPALLMTLLVLLFALLMLNAPLVITVVFLSYTLSGWVIMLLRWRKARRLRSLRKTE
ncbi:CDP-diacylglycerol--serine O-phosphatidyltransferase [Oligella urethralis DNF00040]|uniref:CDP-diacylglycerol--serine O-phosphatidyltransferase n=1 Tax=Oligella urethralis DNF00040 TaxID=1401065 RepID=A0A095Z0X5_9BURK|nr:CDP-diacylglycerol--serine O-phosphatidyltransferase [Oligella urethralis DNF00040]